MRRATVFVLLLAVVASSSIFTRIVTKSADAAALPAFRQAVGTATGGGTSITLPSWSPRSDELILVGVVSQAWRKLDVGVSGNGLAFQQVAKVHNAQGIQTLTVFRAHGNPVAGRIVAKLPGNAGAAAVTAVRVGNASLGSNGANAIRAVVPQRGPSSTEGDNSHMKAKVTAKAGDLVVAFGAHRLTTFVTPANQSSAVLNVSAGTDGQRIAASTWHGRMPAAGVTTMGADGDLVGRRGGDDWAMMAIAVSAQTDASPSTTVAPPASSSSTVAPTTSTVAPTTSTSTTVVPSTSTTVPGGSVSCAADGVGCRPYDPASPWNTPIPASATIHPKSATYVKAIADNGLPLSSDVDQYTIPVYTFDANTPLRTVKMSGYFSTYDAGDNSRKGYGFAPTITGIPVPPAAVQGVGSDGQIVIWNPQTGVEYSFWQFGQDASGQYFATNGYRYHTTAGYHGRFADGLAGRGAGTPYFAGLVRKWEIDQGHIDHALAFAYDSPSSEFVYPASKSDGGGFGGVNGVDLPEGTRLRLNPALTDADFNAWGLSPEAKVIAKALQRYGMYTIDHSGSSKIYLEDRTTARWPTNITRDLVRNIPWNQFQAINN